MDIAIGGGIAFLGMLFGASLILAGIRHGEKEDELAEGNHRVTIRMDTPSTDMVDRIIDVATADPKNDNN